MGLFLLTLFPSDFLELFDSTLPHKSFVSWLWYSFVDYDVLIIVAFILYFKLLLDGVILHQGREDNSLHGKT